MNRRHAKLLTLTVTALVVLSLAPGASAFTTRAPLGSFGVDGTSGTRFGDPAGLAFDQARDKLYVHDNGLAQIHCFNVPAHSRCGGTFPLAVAASGPFGSGIAVDNTAGSGAGNIFYPISSRLFGFNSAGTSLGGNFPIGISSLAAFDFGATVDSTGNIWVTDRGVTKYNSAGDSPGTVVLSRSDLAGGPSKVALDSVNNLYVGLNFSGGAYRYTAASNYRTSTQLVGAARDTINGLSVDRITGRVYVEGNNDVKVFDSSGTLLYQFGQVPGGSLSHKGVTIDESTDRAYVSDGGSDRVWIFGPPADYPNASATSAAAANIAEITADLSGTVDDNSALATTWRFEVSKDAGATWTSAGISGTTQGSQSGVTVSGTARNLLQDTDYRARIAINKGPGSTDVLSNEVTFRTVAIPAATAMIDPAANVTADRADLRATITDNSPFPTNWRFEISKDGGASWTNAGVSNATARGDLTMGTTTVQNVIISTGDFIVGKTITGSGVPSGTTITAVGSRTLELSKAATATGTAVDLTATPITAGGQSSVAVSVAATGLIPDTDYMLRIVTNKGHGAPDVIIGGTSFRTQAVPPVLSRIGTFRLLDTSAYLVASINPRNAETRYFFEYGDEGPCDTNACVGTAEATIDGNDDVVVHPQITGLKADTTYHFRLTATNAAGPVTSADFTFHTLAALPVQPACDNEAIREAQGSTYLPECRAYEQVSPVNKNFGHAIRTGLTEDQVAVDGQAITYRSNVLFGDPPSTTGSDQTAYVSRRGPEGWRTKAVYPNFCKSGDSALGGPRASFYSSSLNYAVISVPEPASCPLPKLVPGAPDSPLFPTASGDVTIGLNSYRADLSADPTVYALLRPTAEPLFPGKLGGDNHTVFFGTSDDASHIIFSSLAQQTPDAPAGDFDKLFDWHNGTLRLVSKDVNDVPFATVSLGAAFGSESANEISVSGDRIFFSNPATGVTSRACSSVANCDIYMREDGTTTYKVSESECAASCGASAGMLFRRATPDGSKALFLTAEKLTNDDTSITGNDLFLYTHSEDPANDENLTLLSKDQEPADGRASDVQEVVGMSERGDVVYFTANGQLVPGGAIAAGIKLYRWRHNDGSPTLIYIATLGSDGGGAATLDGRYLFRSTSIQLDPVADQDASRDHYRWSEADGWSCLSCQLPGMPSAHIWPGIAFSDDGRSFFFLSHDSLVPEDTNNGVRDVYEWRDGRLDLISSGKGVYDAELFGSHGSGANVYFTTTVRLVTSDIDEAIDVYVARVGGGLASQNQPPPGPPCDLNAGACEGGGSSAPTATGAGTAAFEGPGDPPPTFRPSKRPCPRGKRKVTRKGKTRCIRPPGKRRGAKKHKAAANGRVSR